MRIIINILLTVMLSLSVVMAAPALPTLDQSTSKGLRMSIIRDPSLMFLHAEIVIYYSDIKEPAVPYLTLMNIFDDQVNDPQSGILNTLFKMGNDYEIDYKIDHFIIKVNFLNDDINVFIDFLKDLFSYRSFSLKDFGYSTEHFWELFKKNSNWRQILAAQIAFSKLFAQDHPGKFLVPGMNLKQLNLSHIRSFYKNNYLMPNSFLTLRGDVNPYVVFGLIEKAFKNFKNLKANYPQIRYNRIRDDRNVIIVDEENNGTPYLYWIEPIPSPDTIDHHHTRIVNNILFGYPLGRISTGASGAGIKNFNISWVTQDHSNISILCNRVRITAADIEKFIFIADNMISKLGAGRISRKEYLDSYNFVFQEQKIRWDDFRTRSEYKITESFFGPGSSESAGRGKDFLKDLNYASFNTILSDPSGNFIINRNRKKGIIVIFGNAETITRHLKNIKPEIVTLR